jgi:hypothetical protein
MCTSYWCSLEARQAQLAGASRGRWILEVNPAASMRDLKYVVKRGKTPALSAAEAIPQHLQE